jgi:hypothetical protein
VLWGPTTIDSPPLCDPNTEGDCPNIASPPAVEDVDGDGMPEILVAAGNLLWCLNHDGSLLWEAAVTDNSGATGASFFDFEGDGVPEVVYIDEVQMVAYDGPTGAVKFQSTNHASNTLFDYPVIADVDANGHADIVVAHNFYSSAVSIYRDVNDSWAPARTVWNQHAYAITNIHDDLSVPTDAEDPWLAFNSWHSAMDREPSDGGLVDDVEAEIVGVCDDDCGDAGVVYVVGRLLNKSSRELPSGIPVTLYARAASGALTTVETRSTAFPTPSGQTGEPIEFEVPAAQVQGADALVLRADDLGAGGGVLPECSETNNTYVLDGPFCE